MGAGADYNATYDFRKPFKEAGHKRPLSADPSFILSHSPWPSAEALDVGALLKTIDIFIKAVNK
jgi:hypothetical protein